MTKKFYIEVGAHNGIFQSQTKCLEDTLEWNGMLIEPNPVLFEQCKLNRNSLTNIFVNECLVPRGFKESFVEFFTYDNIGACGRMKGYFYNETERGDKILVPAININDLLERHGIKTIDFFSIDIEGADIDILDSIDFDKRDYKKILVEIHHHINEKIKHLYETYSNIFDIVRLIDKDKQPQPHYLLTKK